MKNITEDLSPFSEISIVAYQMTVPVVLNNYCMQNLKIESASHLANFIKDNRRQWKN